MRIGGTVARTPGTRQASSWRYTEHVPLRFWVTCLVVGALAGAPSVLDACSLFCESPLETGMQSHSVSAGAPACHHPAPAGTARHALSPKAHACAYDGDIPLRVEGLRAGTPILSSQLLPLELATHGHGGPSSLPPLRPPASTRPSTLRI